MQTNVGVAFYIHLKAFCTCLSFMAVLYAENLMLFRSAVREQQGRWNSKKRENNIRNEKKAAKELANREVESNVSLQWS